MTTSQTDGVAGTDPEKELLRKALSDLRGAASSLYSEIAGTTQTMRAHRRIEELREPMRQAWCVLNGKEYQPSARVEDSEPKEAPAP